MCLVATVVLVVRLDDETICIPPDAQVLKLQTPIARCNTRGSRSRQLHFQGTNVCTRYSWQQRSAGHAEQCRSGLIFSFSDDFYCLPRTCSRNTQVRCRHVHFGAIFVTDAHISCFLRQTNRRLTGYLLLARQRRHLRQEGAVSGPATLYASSASERRVSDYWVVI